MPSVNHCLFDALADHCSLSPVRVSVFLLELSSSSRSLCTAWMMPSRLFETRCILVLRLASRLESRTKTTRTTPVDEYESSMTRSWWTRRRSSSSSCSLFTLRRAAVPPRTRSCSPTSLLPSAAWFTASARLEKSAVRRRAACPPSWPAAWTAPPWTMSCSSTAV